MKVTAWNVENAKPGDDAPEVPMTWPRQCLACVQHAVSMDTVDEAEGMVIADWRPWVGQWVPMCAPGIANYRRNKHPVAVPAAFDRGLNTNPDQGVAMVRVDPPEALMLPRQFILVRKDDPTGISGTGMVAQGVQFYDGIVVLRWLPTATARPEYGVRPTTVVHESISSVIALHGHGDSTYAVFADGSTLRQSDLDPTVLEAQHEA